MVGKQFGLFLQLVIILFTGMGLILGVSGNSHAQNFDGGYLGASAGMAHYSAEISEGGASMDGISADDPVFGIIAGYGGSLSDNKYFGIEGNVGMNTADLELSAGDEKIEIDAEETYGISARLGYTQGNWMAYGLMGWQWVNMDAKYRFYDADSDSFESFSEDEDFNGFRVGVGAEYQSAEQLFLRGEYSYTMYNEEGVVEPDAGVFQLSIGLRFN